MSRGAVTASRWMIDGQRHSALERFAVDPDGLAPREVLIETAFSAVSPGTEVAIYTAADPDVFRAGGWCRYPWRAGYSGVGRVVACGQRVTEYAPGDRVLGQLGHASHWVIDLDRMLGPEWSNRQVGPVEPRLKDTDAALIRLAGIAMTACQVLPPVLFGSVAVFGLGLIGNLAAQLLGTAGYRVIGVDPLPSRRRLARGCGVNYVLDPGNPEFASGLQAVSDGGLDVVVDTVGKAALTVTLPSFLKPGGHLVLLTHWRSQPLVDASALINATFNKGISLHGGLEYGPGSAPWQSWPRLQLHKWQLLQPLVAEGRLRLSPLVSQVVTPDRHDRVYGRLSTRPNGWLTVLIDWRPAPA